VSLSIGELAFEQLAVGFDPTSHLVEISLRKRGASISDDELPLEPADSDAAFLQSLSPELTLEIQDTQGGGSHLTAETLESPLPGKARRVRRVFCGFEVLIELAKLFLGAGQFASVLAHKLVDRGYRRLSACAFESLRLDFLAQPVCQQD
jgi:hypothetical protein